MINKKFYRASVLAYILVLMSVVSIILVSSIQFVVSRIKYSYYVNHREQAFQISEAGIHYFRWYLAHNTDGRTAEQIKTFWNTRTPLAAETSGQDYFDPNGSVIGKYKLEVTPPATGSTIVMLKSIGWTLKDPANKRTIEVRLRRPSWSEYIALADDFMRFGQGTETFGKVKSNEGIRFDGLAHNVVISSISTYNDPDHTGASEFGVHTHVNAPPGTGVNDNFRPNEAPPNAVPARIDVFQGGRQMDLPETDFNGVLADLNFIKSVAQAGTDGSKYFDFSNQGRHIILKSNGTFDIRTVKNFHGNGTDKNENDIDKYVGDWANYPLPDNGVIFVENNIWIEGTINDRRLTIVSANLSTGTDYNVYLKNDIRYTNYDGRDVLGIISQNNVEVIQNSEDDLRIDAALLAQNGRVGRKHYTPIFCFWESCKDIKDIITIYGAIATKQRYGFAYTDGTGYQDRNLIFDNNLLYFPPPYFPSGTEYLLDLWKEL